MIITKGVKMKSRKTYDLHYNKNRKNRYATDKKFRERIKVSVKKYNLTKKGKKTYKKGQKNFRKKHLNYMINYMRKRRKQAIKNGLCIRCLKPNNDNKYKTCIKCREKDNLKHKQKNNTFLKKIILLFKKK